MKDPEGYRAAAVESIEHNKLQQANAEATLAVSEAVEQLTDVVDANRKEASSD
ncbi:hypothetical protein [Amycolatopsis sp. cmx-11-12]|uniref:hypothetical protein n=1 Tax=Amycolatopsis sp. cmx-11-12 TaxID=2785795 RepID=UPI003917EC32